MRVFSSGDIRTRWFKAIVCGIAILCFDSDPTVYGQARSRCVSDPVDSWESAEWFQSRLAISDWGSLDDAELIELLTCELQGERQLAMLEVWRRRGQLRSAVKRLATDKDPEVRGRANWILGQWSRGVVPDTPKDLSQWLFQRTTAESLQGLLQQGCFRAVVVALEESASRPDAQAVRDRVAADLANQFSTYAFRAYETGSVEDLIEILDLVSNTVELAVSRYQLASELGILDDSFELLPSAAGNWTPLLRLQAECVLRFLHGDLASANEKAKQSIDPELLIRLRMVTGDWESLAEDLALRAKGATEGSLERTRLLVLTLSASDRALESLGLPARMKQLRDEAVAQILDEPIADSVEGKLAATMRWKGLASHGEVDQAIQLLGQVNPSDAAALCKDSSRIVDAFDAMGRPLNRVDIDLEEWLSDALKQQRASNGRDLTPKVREMLTLMQCLIAIGYDERAFEIANELANSGVKLGTIDLREFVLSTLSLTKKMDWILQLAVPDEAVDVTLETYNTISRNLADCELVTLRTAVNAFVEANPDASLGENLRQAVELFLASDFEQTLDHESQFLTLFTYLFKEPATGQNVEILGRNEKSARLNLDFVNLFRKHGKTRFAEMCLQGLISKGDREAILVWAQWSADAGRVEEAEEAYREITRTLESPSESASPMQVKSDLLPVQARIGLWQLAKLRQDKKTAAELLQGIRFAMCSPNLSARNELGEYLADNAEPELALEILGDLLPIVALGQRGRLGLYDVARRYAPLVQTRHPESAARWFDLALNQTLFDVDFRAGAYVTLPMFVNRWALEAEIRDEDRDRIQFRLTRMLQLDAMDIDFAERLLPMMRELGMEANANEVLDEIMDQGLQHAARFPFDAMTANNVAWVAAVNQRRLEDALILSKAAVRAEPESPVYRDTLAEVLFLLGRPQEALQIEEACLLDDPTQWHLHEQCLKYRAGIVE